MQAERRKAESGNDGSANQAERSVVGEQACDEENGYVPPPIARRVGPGSASRLRRPRARAQIGASVSDPFDRDLNQAGRLAPN